MQSIPIKVFIVIFFSGGRASFEVHILNFARVSKSARGIKCPARAIIKICAVLPTRLVFLKYMYKFRIRFGDVLT